MLETPEKLFTLVSELPRSLRDSIAENYLQKGKYMEERIINSLVYFSSFVNEDTYQHFLEYQFKRMYEIQKERLIIGEKLF